MKKFEKFSVKENVEGINQLHAQPYRVKVTSCKIKPNIKFFVCIPYLLYSIVSVKNDTTGSQQKNFL